MTPEKFKRKLTAILSADVKGYSRLMGEDEEGTLRTLNSHKEVLTGFIQKHQGRVVGSAGDSVLAEFGSVVDAVRCAVEIQEELKDRNRELPEGRRMEFRIGVNLGDVVEEGDTIYGDGVNIAARLESLADGGGICISGTVYEHIKNKLAFGYELVGEQTVKNIKEPVRVYRVLMEPGVTKAGKGPRIEAKGKRTLALGILALFVVIVAAVAIWRLYLRSTPPHPPLEVASKEKMAFSLPDKPSIAVLPFTNMSDDPKQEYFSDGMTEDLITDLSKISGLFVIARNSTFTYKGKAVKIRQVAEDLGVRYVLEGSIRKAGDQVRINVQLIDATTGLHLWADRYDGKMGDVFSLQDKVTQKIVSALAVKLTPGEKELVARKGTGNVEAYDEFLRGWEHYLRIKPDDLAKAVQSFKRAIELDPNYARAHAALALAYWQGTQFGGLLKGLGVSWFEGRLRSGQYLRLAMKNPNSLAHQVNSQFYLNRRQHEEAISELERALTLDPNDPNGLALMARTLNFTGKPKEAVDFANRAMRLDPQNPAHYLWIIGMAQFCMGRLEEAATFGEKALKLNPEWVGPLFFLAATYGQLGREREARAALDTYLKKGWAVPIASPNLQAFMNNHPFKTRQVADRFAEGLIKAGLPGKPSGYYHGSKENRLSGEKIKAILFGSRITGILPGYQQWGWETDREGQLIFRGPDEGGKSIIDGGRIWIDGDMGCNQYQKANWGLEWCWTVFKNPNGTPESKDEYFFASDIGIYPFSPVR